LKPVDTFSANLSFHQQHAMLLYSSDEDNAATKYVNEALKKGYLTIYISINGDTSKIAPLESIDYEENVNQANLLTFDTRTFYKFALAGNLEPFEELKVLLEEAIREKRIAYKRNEDDDEEEELNVVVVAGVAAELNRNEKFDECIKLEKWCQDTHSEWLQKGLKVTVICPHLNPKLGKGEFAHYKQAISSLHEIVVESPSER
jgi:hypothetical protein